MQVSFTSSGPNIRAMTPDGEEQNHNTRDAAQQWRNSETRIINKGQIVNLAAKVHHERVKRRANAAVRRGGKHPGERSIGYD